MKIYFVLLCLLISNVWANATVQNSASQDKPPRLYVKSYNINNNDLQTIDQNVENGGNFIIAYQEKMNWQDGCAGSYYETYMDSNDFDSTSSVLSQSWPPSFWPNITAVQINSGSSYGWPYWTNENSSATNTSAPVYIYQEHCDATFTSYSSITTFPPGVNPDPYYINKVNDRRITDTTVHLQTGGKAISKLKNLFGISASATQNNPANYSWDLLPGNEGYGLYSTNIPSQDISIGSFVGTLNTNGVKYLILADDSDVDATPHVAGVQYYSFNVSQQKYCSYFDVFVQQANPGYSLSSSSPTNDVGHAFWRFRTEAPSDALQYISSKYTAFLNTPWGFYPNNALFTDPGQLENDTGHSYNISRTFHVGFPDLLQGLIYTSEISNAPPVYVLSAFNCVGAARSAGFSVDVFGLPQDETPQNFGVTLIEMYPAPGQAIGPFIDTSDVFYSSAPY